jgi:23S rRNA (uracil1939-C5)-methyltransferase
MEIKKNSIHKVQITGMTHEGQGVGRIDNFTIFIDGAIIGETVEIIIIKINKSYGIGKLTTLISPSPNRISSFCPVFDKCGGCSLQHMSYQAQLEFKTNLVKDNLKRLGKLENVIVHDTIGMETPLNYRNKAQYPVGMDKDKLVTGFYSKRSHRIIEADHCGIQDILSNQIRTIVNEFINVAKLSVYDEISNKGLLRHVMTRVGFKTGEVMVVIVINDKQLPQKTTLIDMLIDKIPNIKSIFLNINTKNTNIILGEENIKIYGSDTITDKIGKYIFNISPLSFFQVNPVQTDVLYEKAIEYAGLTGVETAFDLYCGIGTISLFLSGKAKKVYGVEIVESAILDARKNAEINNVENIKFITGEAEKIIPDLYGKGVKADVVVVDPPRKGCDQELLDTLVKMQPDRIVYVSCNPATLARDLSFLSGNGFRTVEVQPVDMFPHTAHVETVVLMSRV